MSTKFPQIFCALAKPLEFSSENYTVKEQRAVISNRLDKVLGPENWTFKITVKQPSLVQSLLVLTFPDGLVQAKQAVLFSESFAGDQVDLLFVRCADEWGVGSGREYFYDFSPSSSPVPSSSSPVPSSSSPVPSFKRIVRVDKPHGVPSAHFDYDAFFQEKIGQNAPVTGKGFFAVLKQVEKTEAKVFDHFRRWTAQSALPQFTTGWSAAQLAKGLSWLVSFLDGSSPSFEHGKPSPHADDVDKPLIASNDLNEVDEDSLRSYHSAMHASFRDNAKRIVASIAAAAIKANLLDPLLRQESNNWVFREFAVLALYLSVNRPSTYDRFLKSAVANEHR